MKEYEPCDVGYGDCRDSCMAFLIEGEFACLECAEEMDRAEHQEEEQEYYGEVIQC